MTEATPMSTTTGSNQRKHLDGKAAQNKPVEPWNDPHLGVAAEVYRRFRPAMRVDEKDEPWNDPKLGVVAEVYGWCRNGR